MKDAKTSEAVHKLESDGIVIYVVDERGMGIWMGELCRCGICGGV